MQHRFPRVDAPTYDPSMRGGTGLWLLLLSCGGEPSGGDDAGAPSDAAGDDADAAIAVTPVEPGSPRLTPCPAGWREIGGACEPLPDVDPASCATGEAIFPGDSACTPVGTPCTDDPWAADLPAEGDAAILFVASGGTGDGTRDDPLGSIADALAVPQRDGIVAIAKGTYRELVPLAGGRTLWGACVAETRIEAPSPSEQDGTVSIRGAGTHVQNLTIAGDRPAVWVVGDGRDVALEGVILDGASFMGWVVADGASAAGHDVVVRGTRARADGRFGQGINVQDASLDVERAVVEGNRHVGVSVTGLASVRLADTAIRGTFAEDSSGTFGRALNAQEGATATLERVVVEGNREVSVYVSGAALDATDLLVRDTAFDDVGNSGDGLQVREGATVELHRARFERNVRVAIAVKGAGASLVAEDTTVADTLAQPDGRFGQGLLALGDGSSVEAHRLVVERSRHVAVSFDGAVEGTLDDVTIRDTEAQALDGASGRGLNVQGGAQVALERVRVDRSRDVGLFVSGEGTRVTGVDCQIADTAARACAESTCADAPAGIGAGVYEGASLTLESFRVAAAPLCCVQLARAGEADLVVGEVTGCSIGLNLQVDGYDFGRLSDRVSYHDNARNLDAATLPLPLAEGDQPL